MTGTVPRAIQPHASKNQPENREASVLLLVRENLISEVESKQYTVRFARTEQEIEEVFRLRYEIFKKELDRNFSFQNGMERDAYDDQAHHLIAIDNRTDAIVGTYRLQLYEHAVAGVGFTSGVRFQLELLPEEVVQQAVEVGRVCIREAHRSGRVLFMLWRGLARYLDHFNKRYLFGYAALDTHSPAVAIRTLAYLKENDLLHPQYVLPPRDPYALEIPPDTALPDEIDIPPLLQNYIQVGSKVCGGPSYDRALNLIHFLILLDIESISNRTRSLFFGR